MQSEIIQKLNTAIAETEDLLTHGDDPLLRSFVTELQRYKRLTEDHWALSISEKVTVDIGRVAVRELDDAYPEYVTKICQLGTMLREEK